MTSAGRVMPVGTFGMARVRAISGGTNPRIVLRHGRDGAGPAIASCDATLGAEIDLREQPVECPTGLWLAIAGDPASIDVEVLWR